MSDVTSILSALEEGDETAPDRLLEAVHAELHRLASAKLARERVDHTLQPTALVNEAWLRLAGNGTAWENRRHFFGAAAEAMRRILVDRARRRSRLKHGGAHRRLSLDDVEVATEDAVEDVLQLDEALDKLAAEDPRKAELVKLRHFGGLQLIEAARLLGISKATADRWWAYARAFLYHEVRKGERE